jgi:hypothetical protein
LINQGQAKEPRQEQATSGKSVHRIIAARGCRRGVAGSPPGWPEGQRGVLESDIIGGWQET